MEKYNEILLFKIGMLICALFLGVLICSTTDIKADMGSFFKKDKKNENNTVNDIQLENTIISGEYSAITENRLIITLPKGVKEEHTTITKNLIEKQIVITFPKGAGDYDVFASVVNNTQVISNINRNIGNNMITLELTMNSVLDCIPCFDNGQLFMDFFRPAELEGSVVVIDAGHGGDDVGAIENGVYEKDIDLAVCLQLEQLLEQEDITVYYTRLEDSFPSVEERADFVNEIQPDLFISIHANWYKNSRISGSSVLYNSKDNNEFGSAWLCNIMCEELVKECNTVNKGIVDGNDIHIVRSSQVPVALLEIGFMSNESDFKLLTTQEGQEKIARGIYNGIIRSLTELGKY